jgi:D-beta-D-heptose 7-phosphate kinase/D-beta-D-heptose 1-phosphate adenosyltransferase
MIKVIVIGDACIDEYRFGSILRINPEAPVPLLNASSVVQRNGMALNVASNIKAFGVDVILKTPTVLSKKIRYVDERTGRHLLRVDYDTPADPYKVEEEYDCDAIIVSDYAKGFISDSLIVELQERFSGPIFVDTKKINLKDYKNVYYKINEVEFSRLNKDPENLIVTLGAKGCLYKDKIFSGVLLDTLDVLDVCGAGDVFLAALTYGYLKFESIEKAIKLANSAAALSCQHLGTYTLTQEDVECIS